MAITDWPQDERPRERLLSQGAAALSDAELLAIFLRVGVAGKSAVDLARDLLSRFGSLSGVFGATHAGFCAVPGLGGAKYAQLQAVLEMARRALKDDLKTRDLLSAPAAVRDWLRLNLAHLPHECFVAMWLDAGNRLIAHDELFRGTLTRASVYPREVVKQALARNAAAAIFAHNHPSGSAAPSAEDESLTAMLKQALELVDVRLLDHFIVAGNVTPMSFSERGLI